MSVPRAVVSEPATWWTRPSKKEAVAKRPPYVPDFIATCPYDFMIFRPALRFLTEPRPPRDFAARFLAAVILPPLLFFAILNPPPSSLELGTLAIQVEQAQPNGNFHCLPGGRSCQWGLSSSHEPHENQASARGLGGGGDQGTVTAQGATAKGGGAIFVTQFASTASALPLR